MRNHLQDMMVLLDVVDSGSFTLAGDKLGISKAMLSKRIARLEKGLGVQVLNRTTRRISLTEAGSVIYDQFNRVKDILDVIESEITHSTTQISGQLIVNSPLSYAQLHLVPMIASFMRNHPSIQIQLRTGDHFDDMVRHGIDLSIRVGNLPDSSLKARLITNSRVIVCAAPSYLEKNGCPQHPEDLKSMDCLLYHNSPSGKDWRFVENDEELTTRIESSFIANSAHSLESAAIEGMGLIMLPDYMMSDALEKGLLVRVLEDYCHDIVPIYAVYPSNEYLPKKTRAFIDFMVEYFSS